jgi:hypothetical protein
MYYLDRRLAPRAGLPPPESARAQRRELLGRARSEWELLPPVAPPLPVAPTVDPAGAAGPSMALSGDPADAPPESAWAEMFGEPAPEPEPDEPVDTEKPSEPSSSEPAPPVQKFRSLL